MSSASLLLPLAFTGSSFVGNSQITTGIPTRVSVRYYSSFRIGMKALINRRNMIGLTSLLVPSLNAYSAGLPPQEIPRLCDESCEKQLENIPMVTTESGLQYKDIKLGSGPTPPIGYQVAANYVAMLPNGQVFDRLYAKLLFSIQLNWHTYHLPFWNFSSLEKRQIYIFRVGSGQVVKGLDEGILSMKVGGLRRIYVPGSLAFPKGLTSAPGRPRVAANSPVIFDVSLEYIPGLDYEEE